MGDGDNEWGSRVSDGDSEWRDSERLKRVDVSNVSEGDSKGVKGPDRDNEWVIGVDGAESVDTACPDEGVFNPASIYCR